MWKTGAPDRSKPGVTFDRFLVIPLDSDNPEVLYYNHNDQSWTSGGGDTQKVRYWQVIEPIPAAKED